MTSGKAQSRLVCFVNPNTDNLARSTHGDVQGDRQAYCCRGVEIRREPAQQRRDAGKGSRCGDYEASIPLL